MSFYNFTAKKALLTLRKPELDRLRNLDYCRRVQEKTLQSLIQHAKNTKFGIDHRFSGIRNVRDYQNRVPLRTYENYFEDYFFPASVRQSQLLKSDHNPKQTSPYLDNIIWPGLVRYFSLSSGTTSGTTKFIPMTHELIKANQRASIDAVLFHFVKCPQSKIFDGKTMLLGGDPTLRTNWGGCIKSGDLSGVMVHHLPRLFHSSYFPGAKLASISNWEEKIEQIAAASLNQNLSALSGIPTWMILFLEKLNEKKKFKGDIRQIWPKFEVLVHGGVPFEPYRKQFEEWLGPRIRFLEVYPASEAFIALQDPNENELRLMTDYGTFYEFVPVDELSSKNPARLTILDIEIGKNYAVVLTTNGGLWSYILGDTLRFLSKESLLFKITGRTKYYLSAFGEHLIEEEIETALNEACAELGAAFLDYHVAPIFPDSQQSKGRHQFVIEFSRSPGSIARFSEIFDMHLQKLNEDYAQHRCGGFGMGAPEFIAAPGGFFKEWMKKKGKLGGQHKVPRISKDRTLISDMLNDLPAVAR